MKENEPNNPMPLLRERLHGLESDAPGLGWDAFMQHRKKRRYTLFWSLGFVLLALLSATALYIGYRKSAEKHQPVAKKHTIQTRQQLHPNQDSRQTVQASSGHMAVIQSVKTQQPELSAGSFLAPDTHALPATPVRFHDPDTLPGLYFRPLRQLSEMLAQPQSRLPALAIAYHKLNQIDSWSWYWGLSMGAGIFKPVTQSTASGQAFVHRDYSALRRRFEAGLFSQNLRLQMAAMKGNWMFSAGIGVHRQAVQANYDFVYSEAPVIDRDGRIIAYAAAIPQRIAFNSTHYLTSTELPVSVAWRFRNARDYSLYLRLGAMPSFIGSIKGSLPDPVLLDRRENLSPVNYRISSQSFSLALPIMFQTGTNGRLELSPEWKWHSGLRQVHGHYLSRYNQSGITCSYYVRF